jgi:hypothetical protein
VVARIEDQRMTLSYRDKGTTGTQLEVITGSIVIGSLRKESLSAVAGLAMLWRWTLYVSAAPQGMHHHGSADSREQAQADIERHWTMWVKAAGLSV